MPLHGVIIAAAIAAVMPLHAPAMPLHGGATPLHGGRRPVPPAGAAFTCTPAAVWDGDGPIWCAQGPRLRLARVAARERDGTCRAKQPCPAMSGVAARDVLVELLGGARGTTRDGHVLVDGPPLACRSRGPDKYYRTLADCTLPGGADLGDARMEAGAALGA